MFENNKGIIVVLEGPSGVGKDSIMNRLIELYPNNFERVISTTTREMRQYESQGNPYYFVTDDEFNRLVDTGVIFEQTERHGTKRGMSKTAFDNILNHKKVPIKDCDKVGLKALKNLYGNKVFGVFITASKDSIAKRLTERGDNPEDVKVRLANYEDLLKQKEFYDVNVENTNLEKATLEVLNEIKKHYEKMPD